MGVGFSDAHGSAQKTGLDYIKLEFGETRFRMVGDLRPRYAYWKELKSNSIPVECLSFDPEQEKFTNIEKDWFKHYFPEAKCVWSYVIQVLDGDVVKLCGLKKKLFDQIQTAAKSLGDPTDYVDGYTLVIDKKKTGPNRFNVEYTLDVLATQKTQGPLTDEQLEAVKELKSIDDLIPRMSADDQRAFIENAWVNVEETTGVDAEAIDELNDTPIDPTVDDDVKF
jgi:hypothetical protein